MDSDADGEEVRQWIVTLMVKRGGELFIIFLSLVHDNYVKIILTMPLIILLTGYSFYTHYYKLKTQNVCQENSFQTIL